MLRRDHVAGGAFVGGGIVVLALSRDLPLGTPASPGAGMLPVFATVLMMVFGIILVARAPASPPLGAIPWADLPHAARVVALVTAATAAYATLGFLVTMSLLLFLLLFAVERRGLPQAVAFSLGVPLLTALAFRYLLRSPLEPGLLGF